VGTKLTAVVPDTPISRPASLRFAWVELFLVLLLAPVLAFPPLGHPWLLFLPFLLPVLWLIKPPPVTPLNGSLLLLLAAILLSLAASFDIAYSTGKVLGVLLGVAFFFAVVRSLVWRSALDVAIETYAVAGGAAFWTYGNSRLSERVVGGGLSSDVESRIELWSRAIYMIEDFPFTGVGMNNFRRVMPVMYPAFFTPPETDIAHAHNQLLNTGAELGVAGLVAYLAILLGVAAMLVRTWRTTSDDRLRWVAAGLGAGFLAFFGFGMADAIALGAKLGIVFWAALALVVAVDARSREALP
jgi:putative inorganic carbon (HCO3(-)) transporter